MADCDCIHCTMRKAIEDAAELQVPVELMMQMFADLMEKNYEPPPEVVLASRSIDEVIH